MLEEIFSTAAYFNSSGYSGRHFSIMHIIGDFLLSVWELQPFLPTLYKPVAVLCPKTCHNSLHTSRPLYSQCLQLSNRCRTNGSRSQWMLCLYHNVFRGLLWKILQWTHYLHTLFSMALVIISQTCLDFSYMFHLPKGPQVGIHSFHSLGPSSNLSSSRKPSLITWAIVSPTPNSATAEADPLLH